MSLTNSCGSGRGTGCALLSLGPPLEKYSCSTTCPTMAGIIGKEDGVNLYLRSSPGYPKQAANSLRVSSRYPTPVEVKMFYIPLVLLYVGLVAVDLMK